MHANRTEARHVTHAVFLLMLRWYASKIKMYQELVAADHGRWSSAAEDVKGFTIPQHHMQF